MARYEDAFEPPFFIEKELPTSYASLFHYTNAEAAVAIIRSNQVWANHYKSMNDASEFMTAQKTILRSVLAASWETLRSDADFWKSVRHDQKSRKELIRADAGGFLRAAQRTCDKLAPVHLACFSVHSRGHEHTGGILSQWRSYGSAVPVALEFCTRSVIDCTEHLTANEAYFALCLNQVTYGTRQKRFRDQVRLMPEFAALHAKMIASSFKGKAVPNVLDEGMLKFLFTSIANKHPAFEDEREVRLIAMPILNASPPKDPPNWIDTSKEKSRIGLRILDALKGAIIGPAAPSDQAQVEKALIDELRRSGREALPIKRSDIPFRPKS